MLREFEENMKQFCGSDDIVVLNIAGLKFKTRRTTLQRYPDTLLGLFIRYIITLSRYFGNSSRETFMNSRIQAPSDAGSLFSDCIVPVCLVTYLSL